MTGTAYSPVAAGIAGAVGQEDAVGLHGQDLFGAGLGRHDGDLGAEPGEQAQDVALDAVVDGDDMHRRLGLLAKAFVPDPGRLAPDRGLARGDLLGEVEADQAGPGRGAALQVVEVEDAVRRMRDDGVGHALFADQRGQRAGVDARQRDDAAPLQPLVEVGAGAVVGRVGDVGLEHRADGAVRGRPGSGLRCPRHWCRYCRYAGR